MLRRIIFLLASSIVLLVVVRSLLPGRIPSHGLPDIPSPLVHETHEEPPTSSIKNKSPPTSPSRHGSSSDSSGPTEVSAVEVPDTVPAHSGPLHITITETGGSHDEVVAALVHSFGSQRDAIIDLYQLVARYGIVEIMSAFALSNAPPKPRGLADFINHGVKERRPDVFVAATCELDIVKFKTQLASLLGDGKTYLFCVVHHADRWAVESLQLEQHIRPWVEAGKVEFWTLSPHTTKFLQEKSISKWKTTAAGIRPLVRSFLPLFPVALPPILQDNVESKEDLSFGLQGDYDPARRDYESIFRSLSSFLKLQGASRSSLPSAHERDVTLHLLGHGKHPSVPAEVQANVKFDERLAYIDYYSIISRTFALLPAFASNTYLDRKASSSVPAALIGGTPLVATQGVVDAYSYLDGEVVWLQKEGENAMDVVGRVLSMDPNERREKKEKVRKRCAEIIDNNTKMLGHWLNQAMQKVQNEGKL
jgi:hypothetical protein